MRKTLILAVLLGGIATQPLAAQSGANLAPRVDKLEKEMKAVQRKVFPGGGGEFFEPEIGTQPRTVDPAGSPASAPLADLTARVSALETELRSLTEQTELNAFKLRQLEDAMTKYKAEADGRIKALEGSAVPAPSAGTVMPPAVRPTTSGAKPTPERTAALGAVEKPVTGDAGEDAYLYGYRLWEAKFYPEAQAQLKSVVAKYPKHKRASYAQNLLGRAYLDEGKPALAATAFYDSYQKIPKGDRAADSLYYLGVSLTRLKKGPDACKVYDEFDQVYGASASAGLKAQVVRGKADAKCS